MAGYTPNGLYVPDFFNGAATNYDPGGSLTWLKRLEKRLAWRNTRTAVYDRYYRGHHAMQFATPKFQTTFGGLFSEFADNWTPLVVDAVSERLNPQGFRLGTESDKGDKDAWYMWQANNLDSEIKAGFTEALLREECYLLVWNDDDQVPMRDSNELVPGITVEDPSQAIVMFSSESRRKRAAGAKFFTDDDGYPCATVYLPDAVYKYRGLNRDPRSEDEYQEQIRMLSGLATGGGNQTMPTAQAFIGNATAISLAEGQHTNWVPREVDGEDWPLENTLGVVPLIPVRNKTRLMGDSASEIRDVIPLQDAANKFLMDMLIASEYGAFGQRWATGLEQPKNPQTGELIPFPTGPGTILGTKNPDAKFGAFPELSGKVHMDAIQTVVQHIASQTRTPPHYFYLSGHFPSGEAIKSAETGLVAKVRDKMVGFGEALEEAIRLGFRVLGDRRAEQMDSETIWRDPESRTESEHVDAVIKRIAIGVPERQLQEDVGYTQSQIDRFRPMRIEQIEDFIIAQAYALKRMAQEGSLQPVQTAVPGNGGAPGGDGGGPSNTALPTAPIGMPDPTTASAKDALISTPNSPVALDLRGPRMTT